MTDTRPLTEPRPNPIGARPQTADEPWFEKAYRERRIDTIDVLAERMAAMSAAYDWRKDADRG